MSKISKKSRDRDQHYMIQQNDDEFLDRICKTLYYGKLPATERLSLPMTELAAELFSEPQHGHSLDRLFHCDAAKISRSACISPCSFVLAMLYLEQLKSSNQEYLKRVAPSELFLVSLMVASKFLHDDGAEDNVILDEWANSGGISRKNLIQLEKEFLNAIQWEIFIRKSTFWKKLGEMEELLARKMGKRRGWYTYTELQVLLTVDITALLKNIATCFTLLTTTYLLGLLAVIGSIFIVSNIPGNYLQTHSDNLLLPIDIQPHTILAGPSANLSVDFNLDDTQLCKPAPKCLDAADVLKTGILLASIKSLSKNTNQLRCDTKFDKCKNKSSNVEELPTWAWWTSPTLNWLSQTSQMIEDYDFVPTFKPFIMTQYIESLANFKFLDLEAQIDKATKVRIQDQMERTWHIEWTNTIVSSVLIYKFISYCLMRS